MKAEVLKRKGRAGQEKIGERGCGPARCCIIAETLFKWRIAEGGRAIIIVIAIVKSRKMGPGCKLATAVRETLQ